MKKLMVIALSIIVPGMLYAHGPNAFKNGTSKFWQEMNQIHELMHNTSIKSDKIENGISFELTANSESATELLSKQFVDEREKLDSYFKGLEISVDTVKNGVKINLESNDENTVNKLQTYGVSSIYRYLHYSFMGEQYGMGFGGMGYHHGGRGPGMMHGCGGRTGYGPGMMFENEENTEGQPQSYHWKNQHMGYGPSVM